MSIRRFLPNSTSNEAAERLQEMKEQLQELANSIKNVPNSDITRPLRRIGDLLQKLPREANLESDAAPEQ
ncbi:MAG: hypothetical protein ACFB4I_03115 [Cyanophyceae cyanobacterium]